MRRSTRVSWRVRVRLSGVDRGQPFADDCETLVVNLHGCALQSPRSLRPGTVVQLEVAQRTIMGRVMDSVPLDEEQSRWMLGIALEQAGNHWGIQYPPEDWGSAPSPVPPAAATAPPQPAQTASGPLAGDASRTEVRAQQPAATVVPVPPPREVAPVVGVASPAPPPPLPERVPAGAAAPPLPDVALQEIRAQLLQLQQAQAKQEAMLLQERADRQAARSSAEQAVADQLERVHQAKEYVESLVCSFPSLIEAQAQEQAQAILRKFQPPASRTDLEKLVRDAQDAINAALEQRICLVQQAAESAAEGLVRGGQQATEAALEQRLHEIQQAGDAALERRIHEIQQAGEAALERRIREVQQAAEAAVEQRVPEIQQAGEAALEQRVRAAQQATEAALQQFVRGAQQATEAALEQRVGRLKDDLCRELQQMVEERRTSSDAAHAAAVSKLQALEERANHVTALVDLELQNHAEQIVAETVAEIRNGLQQASEVSPALTALVRDAADARAELRDTLKTVQQEHRMYEAAAARLQHSSEAVQTWLAQETEKFQETVRQAFLAAGGEIRGRIAQAVESASAPIEAGSREVQQQMSALVEQHVQELQHHAEAVCQRLQVSSQESQAEIATALQAHISEALERFRHDTQQLAKNSMERWQSAITLTLAAIPKMLADHFAEEP